jgi:formamidopyrimidine-DNA glycosylase
MPELPEVQTTVNGLQSHIVGLTITGVWTDYNSAYFHGGDTIKDPTFFRHFKKRAIGKKIASVSRRAKNILIHLTGQRSLDDNRSRMNRGGATILVHMKMTGHLLYGQYEFDTSAKKDPWQPLTPKALKDPFNRHVHFVLSFDNGRHLALSDVRKFAKVTLVESSELETTSHLKDIGPEPLEKSFGQNEFAARLRRRPHGKVKQVLMDQSVIAGIGNIYADESLWRAGIHPLSRTEALPASARAKLFTAIKHTLSRGINLGGDSTSDYRNVHGEKGAFHELHYAYQRTGETCARRGCGGTIKRIVIGSRGTHFCDTHQKLYK